MDQTELHYITYDPNAIWDDMITAYVNAGGDVLYPGDEKEILLRGVLSMITQVFAGVDNALRMQTLRYAVGDYLDILGEQRFCKRIAASAANSTVTVSFRASGQAKTIPAGTAMTADGEMFYALADDLRQTGYAQTESARILCKEAGSAGNGLMAGAQMQFAVANPAVISIQVVSDAEGGNEKEKDEAYRERIRQYGPANTTTGPSGQYESAAMRVSGEIIDAKAIRISAGQVGVYLILRSDEGAASILDAVEEALSDKTTRPLTDDVTVLQAVDLPYTLNAQYAAPDGSNIASALGAAVTEYQEWQDHAIGRAFNPDRLMAMLYQAGAERVIWGSGSTFNGGDVQYTPISGNQRCKGTITLAVISP